MFLTMILILISTQTLIECKSLFCTHDHWNDYTVNHFQSLFTIGDRVYMRAGIESSKLWVYDIKSEQVLDDPIIAQTMFPGLPIVEFVAAVLCNNCPPKVSNLVIAVGRQSLKDYHKFVVFRLQSDGSITKIDRPEDLPDGWLLRDGEEDFTLDAPFYGFFPEKMVTQDTNSSNIHGFTFLPSHQIFNLKYYTELGRSLTYRNVNPDGSLSDWKEIQIAGTPRVLNSAFYIKDKIYAMDNDPQYFPKISHQIIIENQGSNLIFKLVTLEVDAREFFNCYDNSTLSSVPPVIVSPTNLITTPTTLTTESATNPMTELTTESTTELTTESTISQTIASTKRTESTTTSVVNTLTTITSKEMRTTPSTTSETIATTVVSNSSGENTVLPNDDKENDYILFWIILFILILIILLIIFGLICLVTYFRKRDKGDQYDSLDADGNPNKGTRPGIVLAGSPSTASLRSNQDNTNAAMKRGDAESPSTMSMRSMHQTNKQTDAKQSRKRV